MPAAPSPFDANKFIHAAQVGGIESYEIADGAGRGVRALCVNTGGGLRYRVLVDRGLDIDHAFHNQHSLVLLPHKGVTRASRAYDKGLEWLKSFPIGLLTSCGPSNIGPATKDGDEELGLHGPHSNRSSSPIRAPVGSACRSAASCATADCMARTSCCTALSHRSWAPTGST